MNLSSKLKIKITKLKKKKIWKFELKNTVYKYRSSVVSKTYHPFYDDVSGVRILNNLLCCIK